MKKKRRRSRARKTSLVPTRVYKYRAFEPTKNADSVAASFAQARCHYNKLITIEHVRRNRYRLARARLIPGYEALDRQAHVLNVEIEEVRKRIGAKKAAKRSRVVDPEAAAAIAGLAAERNKLWKQLKAMREAMGPEAKAELAKISASANADARAAIKALRPELYWGTYQLCEASAERATSDSYADPRYNEDPPHRLESRIGVQIQGGISVADLATDTQLQITPMPKFRQRKSSRVPGRLPIFCARGVAARATLRFRIGSEGKRNAPVFAEFPMVMHRPLPEDARIMGAYVTRGPCSARVPWRYDVCIVVESKDFERTLPLPAQSGTTAINFGWRAIDGALRVAMVNPEGETPFDIRLPAHIISSFHHCEKLQGLLDEKFDEARTVLHAWIKGQEAVLPEAFIESFASLPAWKSQHRLAELIWYWRGHRVDGDEEIYPIMEQWNDRYRHLRDWLDHARQHLQDWRANFYREWAKKLTTTSARILVDEFEIAKVALRPQPEEKLEGGQAARANRVIAAPGELRLFIKQACAKYHCEALVAPSAFNTRRCNVCGELYVWAPAKELIHTCPGDGSTWDQDVNNTDNLHDLAASGEVVPLVVPAEVVENPDGSRTQQPSTSRALGAAREALRRSVKIKEKILEP